MVDGLMAHHETDGGGEEREVGQEIGHSARVGRCSGPGRRRNLEGRIENLICADGCGGDALQKCVLASRQHYRTRVS